MGELNEQIKNGQNDGISAKKDSTCLAEGNTIITPQDNAIALEANKPNVICQHMELANEQNAPSRIEQTVSKLDSQGRPVQMSIKEIDGNLTSFNDVTYKDNGNEISSFMLSIQNPQAGNWEYKLAKNTEGSWDVYRKDEKNGGFVLDKDTKRDFGQITVQIDPETKQFEIHATGFDSSRIGDFIKSDGFMSEHALKNKEPITEKMAANAAAKDLLEVVDTEKYSREKLKELLAKHETNSKLSELNTDNIDVGKARILSVGYKQLLADFDKIAKGKNEITATEVAEYATESRNGAVAKIIAETVEKNGKITYPAQLLIPSLFDEFALVFSEDVKAAQDGINQQLKSFSGPNSNFSVKLANDLIDTRFAPDEPQAAFVSPQKDRLLTCFNKDKEVGQIRIRQRTDITRE